MNGRRWRRTSNSATSNWDCIDLRYGPSACSIWVCETLEPEIEICVCAHVCEMISISIIAKRAGGMWERRNRTQGRTIIASLC